MKHLSRKYDVNKETIKSHLIRAGVSIRPRSKLFCLKSAIQLYSTGLNCEQIAKMMGVTEWAINTGLKRSGVCMRDNRHPDRREKSRRMMSERMETLGCIRMGKLEPMFFSALVDMFGQGYKQHTIEPGGHHFDVYAGGVLWELDELEHKTSTARKEKDIKYDLRARELGYEVRHVWEWDFLETGISHWHHTI